MPAWALSRPSGEAPYAQPASSMKESSSVQSGAPAPPVSPPTPTPPPTPPQTPVYAASAPVATPSESPVPSERGGDFGSGGIDFGAADSYEELQNTLSAQGMTQFVSRTMVDKRAEFGRDCAQLRQRLRKRRGFINPRRKHVQYWDLVTAFALLYTTTVTPFEVAAGLKTEIGALYVVNSIINLVFMFDIVVQACCGRCLPRPP